VSRLTGPPEQSGSWHDHFIEAVLGRQLLYPLVLSVYHWLTDDRVLVLSGLLATLVAAWVVVEFRRREPLSFHRVTGLLLIFGAAVGMAVLTVVSRPWITAALEGDYARFIPDRYFITQNMMMAAFLVLLLRRLAELFPRRGHALDFLIVFQLVNFSWLQSNKLLQYSDLQSVEMVARRWRHQLERIWDLHGLLGDREFIAATRDARYAVPINIPGHAVELSPVQMAGHFRAAKSRRDECSISMVALENLAIDPARRPLGVAVTNLRVIPRRAGLLVTFDVEVSGASRFSERRRKLWVTRFPWPARARAYGYALARSPSGKDRVRGRQPVDYLFKAMIFVEGGWKESEIKSQLEQTVVGIGETEGALIARGDLLEPFARMPFSAVVGDAGLDWKLWQIDLLQQWSALPIAGTHNLKAEGGVLALDEPPNGAFDEEAYLRYNPDVARAVANGVLTSGRSHFDVFPASPPRAICRRTVSLRLPESTIQTAAIGGLSVDLWRVRGGALPGMINVIMHGAHDETAAIRLTAPEEGAGRSSSYAVRHLPDGFFSSHFTVTSIDLEFEDVLREPALRIEHVAFLSRAHAP
jgi:hypothetical protein